MDNLERMKELESKMMNSPLSMSNEEIQEFIKLCREEQKNNPLKRQRQSTPGAKAKAEATKSGASFLANLLAQKKT